MKARELHNLGIPHGPAMKAAMAASGAAARGGVAKADLRDLIRAVIDDPDAYTEHPHCADFAAALIESRSDPAAFIPRDTPAPWAQWGDDLDPKSIDQLRHACELPIAFRGALMPDAHVGYGLPIGGVLATENAVIPYAVGVDIACRMKLTVLDLPPNAIDGQTDRLANVLERETRFGVGAKFQKPHDHPVLANEHWTTGILDANKREKARSQLGTSGSGNHFVEFGTLHLPLPAEEGRGEGSNSNDLNLPPGEYLALLSHSGSRGTGAQIASHYSRLAMDNHPGLPKHLKHLAWLDMNSEAGQEYWTLMNLMGEYAAANHAVIHREVARALGAEVLADIENHHNFAWKETHTNDRGESREVYVHRKGATPASDGVLGVIPGSMASPCYVVRGKGNDTSLRSASHGAGRAMSRTQARNSLTWSDAKKMLRDKKVTLLSAGLDEVPMVYKDIDEVMAAQTDLVDTVATFHPRIVKMAPAGERPED